MKNTDSTKRHHYRQTVHKYNIRTVPGFVNHLHIDTLIEGIRRAAPDSVRAKDTIKKIRQLNSSGARLLERRHRNIAKALEKLCQAFLAT